MGEGVDKPFRSDTERTQIRQWEKGETNLSGQTLRELGSDSGRRGRQTFQVRHQENGETERFMSDVRKRRRHIISGQTVGDLEDITFKVRQSKKEGGKTYQIRHWEMRETKLFRSHSGKWGDISYRSDTEKGETKVSGQTQEEAGDKRFRSDSERWR